MTYRHRITFAEMAYTRNPHPARGPEVYSLDELRFYIRRFWVNRMYGICSLNGGKTAFVKACGMTGGHFNKLILKDPPDIQFVSVRLQRQISKAVRNVLTGKIHYESDPKNPIHAIGVYDPMGKPPEGVTELPRDVNFRLQFSRFGPRVHRMA